ncbi:hypothetical protein [Dolichospermum sp. UHCC 0259]|uniref:hypothetical protein n=1 Tax=Dolichospermum sp. UHCC 0259 TaxID=2590010 RepID=UPI001448A325|nr:hypothetical protein [Dolichospermum sp. UHCC 0259]
MGESKRRKMLDQNTQSIVERLFWRDQFGPIDAQTIENNLLLSDFSRYLSN